MKIGDKVWFRRRLDSPFDVPCVIENILPDHKPDPLYLIRKVEGGHESIWSPAEYVKSYEE